MKLLSCAILRQFLAFALPILCLNGVDSWAQTDSSWLPQNGSTDWFDPLNWNNGVPNASGDTARISGSRFRSVEAELTGDATIGALHLSGSGSVLVSGNGPLKFDNPGDDPGLVQTPVRGGAIQAEIAAPISIVDPQGLLLDTTGGSSVTLSGGIASSMGDVTKTGAGQLVLAGDSSGWGGGLVVSAGDVMLEHTNALGTPTTATTIAGGRVLIQERLESPPRLIEEGQLAESFILSSGVLETTENHFRLFGSLHLQVNNTANVRGPFNLRGGSKGDGDLRIVATEFAATSVLDAPLAHSGGVEITSGESSRQFAQFATDNSYGGPTTLNNIQLEVATPGGLGDAAVGTTITNGSNLRLHGASAEDVSAIDSTISLWSAGPLLPELRPTGRYSLQDSVLTTYGDRRGAEVYVLTNPVVLSGTANEISTERGSIRLAGGIQGSGNLLLDPDDNFPIDVASDIDLDGKLEVRGGPVRFVETNVFDGEIFAQNGGRIVVTVDQEFDKIRTGRLVRQGCCSPFGNVEVQDGAMLKLNGLEMIQGTIRGSVDVAEGITLGGFVVGRTLSNVDTGINVNVQAGVVDLNDTTPGRPASNVHIHLQRPRETAISLTSGTSTDATFFLNNGSGVNFGGALIVNSDFSLGTGITLRGDIHLGDIGAHIGGTEELTRIEGQVFGGDLNLGRMRGTPGLNFVNGPAAYTGATRVYSGRIVLSESGRLENTSHIELYANGALYTGASLLDPAENDRIADDIAISLFGGELAVLPSESGVQASERVEHVHLVRGLSSVHGTSFFPGSDAAASATLEIDRLTREPGAVMWLRSFDSRNVFEPDWQLNVANWLLEIENAPRMIKGILPPWMLYHKSQFATMGPHGVTAYNGPRTSLAESDETSIVWRETGPLDRDRVIHAWESSSRDVDMNGYTLTVASGGVLNARLFNGTIVPGQYANGELVISTDFVIDANIRDNGSPTSVVLVGEGEIGGVNTYTGKTYVAGRPGDNLIVKSASALPSRGDVEINGNATMLLRVSGNDLIYELGEVAIRDGGRLIMQSSEGELRADSITLESGDLRGPLAGDFTITKTTDGLAAIYGQSPEYMGKIDVMAGTLNALEGYRAFGKSTVNVYPGGRLVLPLSGGTNSPDLNLRGGSILGDGNGDGTSWNGDVQVMEDSLIFTLNGLDDNTISADITVDGAVFVANGKSLSVVGRPDSSRGLRALDGIHLGQGSVLAGTGSIRSRVEISNQSAIAPGLLGESNTIGALATSIGSPADENLMTWGEGGRYRWEINDANGSAGAPFGSGWDLLQVGTLLEIESTRDNPFIIEPIALTADGTIGVIEGLEPNRTYSWLIVEIGKLNDFTAAIDGFAADKFVIDTATFQQVYPQTSQEQFWLTIDEQGISLNLYVVAEPTGIGTISCLMLGGLMASRWRSAQVC